MGADGDATFVGYHGTSSSFVLAIGHGINPPTGRNFRGRTQLGEGFYTTPDYDMARFFASIAVREAGGIPVVLEVHARNFGEMVGRGVPRRSWWAVAANSPYITGFDYLTAPIAGFEPVRQVKFNPRAYGALRVR